MKPFTIAKALDSGKVDTTEYIQYPALQNCPATVQDNHVYPTLMYAASCKKSSNVGRKLSAMFTPKRNADFYHDLGGRVRISGFLVKRQVC